MRTKIYEFTEYIAPDGSVFRFEEHDKFILSQTGFGMPEIKYSAQSGPFQHGETLYDYRLQPRLIQIIHRHNGKSRNDYWTNRAELINLLRPNRITDAGMTTGVLRKRLSNGAVRDLAVVMTEGPVFASGPQDEWDEWSYSETLRFLAPDPIFYDPTLVTNTFTVSPNDQLVFPFTFTDGSIVFAPKQMSATVSINYVGTWEAFPSFVLTGPLSGPLITLTRSGLLNGVVQTAVTKKIKLNYDISAGEVVTIGLDYGNKYVSNNAGRNLIGVVDSLSDLATFSIVPHPTANNGTNVLYVHTQNANAGASAISMSYRKRYIGF